MNCGTEIGKQAPSLNCSCSRITKQVECIASHVFYVKLMILIWEEWERLEGPSGWTQKILRTLNLRIALSLPFQQKQVFSCQVWFSRSGGKDLILPVYEPVSCKRKPIFLKVHIYCLFLNFRSITRIREQHSQGDKYKIITKSWQFTLDI